MKRVVSPKRIKEYWARFPTSKPSLIRGLETVRRADWTNPTDVKATFNDVDLVTVDSGRIVYVFNIEHNRHRPIAAVHFNTQSVYILRIMTHKQYDRNRW
jgi:mRNA interferase HigB